MGQQYDNGSTSHLRPLSRYITTHDKDGKAVFHEATAEQITPVVPATNREKAGLHVHYHTRGFPVNFTDDQDLQHYLTSPQTIPLVREGGTVCRIVDMGPGQSSPMHRTVSLDYGVVLAGEVELVLEDWDGPRRRMGVGDVCVQRGTRHAWVNPSPDRWSRMLYVLVPSEKLTFGGVELGDELAGMGLPS